VLLCYVCPQVRGAYVKLERARAAELGYESPIWENIQGTHTNFDRCLDALLDEVSGWQDGWVGGGGEHLTNGWGCAREGQLS
jgi:hypothetical protein